MAESIREQRGRIVREAIVTWAKRHRRGRRIWQTGWDDLDDGQREVDMLIGEAVAAAERERIGAHLEDLAGNYPEDVFPAGSGSRDAISGSAMRHAYRNAARSVREDLSEEPAFHA